MAKADRNKAICALLFKARAWFSQARALGAASHIQGRAYSGPRSIPVCGLDYRG